MQNATGLENGIILFNKPNFSPLVFEVLLKYFYTGVISVENNEINLVDIAIASDEIQLIDVYNQLEERLLKNELAWKPKDIIAVFCCLDYELTQYFLDPNFRPSFNILPFRGSPFESKIINAKDAGFIATFPILSRVSSKNEAIICCRNNGPCFGLHVLHITSSSFLNNIVCKSRKHSYEKKIISRETIEIEENEIFQIIDERFSKNTCINKCFKGIFQFMW
ncbi:3242_t:CDS:2, partial [Gigaspora margarita]